jgi:hypothetical protein
MGRIIKRYRLFHSPNWGSSRLSKDPDGEWFRCEDLELIRDAVAHMMNEELGNGGDGDEIASKRHRAVLEELGVYEVYRRLEEDEVPIPYRNIDASETICTDLRQPPNASFDSVYEAYREVSETSSKRSAEGGILKSALRTYIGAVSSFGGIDPESVEAGDKEAEGVARARKELVEARDLSTSIQKQRDALWSERDELRAELAEFREALGLSRDCLADVVLKRVQELVTGVGPLPAEEEAEGIGDVCVFDVCKGCTAYVEGVCPCPKSAVEDEAFTLPFGVRKMDHDG